MLWKKLPVNPSASANSECHGWQVCRLNSTQSRLDDSHVIVGATVFVDKPLSPIPQHNTSHIASARVLRALDDIANLRGGNVAAAGASGATAGWRTDVDHGTTGELGGPGLEGVDETGLADVAVAVVVELDEDKVHLLHGVEGDGGVGARALRSGRDVV